jgi:HJR/Mrr/RecB family endonuclease
MNSHTYGVVNYRGEYTDVSSTERGAKNYATRHGYNEVYIRFNSGYCVSLVASKDGSRWHSDR